jgi:anti-anti-sigma factor
MPDPVFDVSIRTQSGVTVLDLRGDINAAAEPALSAAYAEASADNPPVLLFNFTGVEYINSTGIALIVGLLARARAARIRLLACGLSDHYVEIFALTRLADFMTIAADEASALVEARAAAVSSASG